VAKLLGRHAGDGVVGRRCCWVVLGTTWNLSAAGKLCRGLCVGPGGDVETLGHHMGPLGSVQLSQTWQGLQHFVATTQHTQIQEQLFGLGALDMTLVAGGKGFVLSKPACDSGERAWRVATVALVGNCGAGMTHHQTTTRNLMVLP